jgi:hypothetical protein
MFDQKLLPVYFLFLDLQKDFQATEVPPPVFQALRNIILLLIVFFWVILASLDPDPDPRTQLNPDKNRIGNIGLNES